MIEMVLAISLYWDCEVEYLQGQRSAQAMMPCIELQEQIKLYKFQGDFHEYLQWWRENRDREYAERGYSRDR